MPTLNYNLTDINIVISNLSYVYFLNILNAVNEPWRFTPMDVLQQFYWDSYKIVQESAPHWITLLHDSFRLNLDIWGNFMKNCENYAIDTHNYQAWANPSDIWWFAQCSCNDANLLIEFENAGIPIVS